MRERNTMTDVILTLARWGLEREQRMKNAERDQFGDGPLSASEKASDEALTSSIPPILSQATED